MDHIGKLARTAITEPQRFTSGSSRAVEPEVVRDFSEAMWSLFRESWRAKSSTEADYRQLLRDYANILAMLTKQEILAGLDACVGRSFPPNPSEFFGLAKAATKPRPAAHQPYKRLPAPARDPATAADKLATVRAALRGTA